MYKKHWLCDSFSFEIAKRKALLSISVQLKAFMYRHSFRNFLFGLSIVLFASSLTLRSAQAQKSPWLIKWKGGEVTLPEFESAFQRMNGKPAYSTTLDSLKDFLSVYADYRLKLEQAREEGLDKDPTVLKEIAGYRTMLSGPFILDKELTDPAVRQLYQRRQWDYHAGHFLAAVKDWHNPADTLKAYMRALQAIKMLDAGYPFEYVAMDPGARRLIYQHDLGALHGQKIDSASIDNWGGSDDKSSAATRGDLGFFMAGMTVRPFEDALVNLKPGEYTKMPVKSRYGYHVIYLYSKEPHTGGVHVEHILISIPKFAGTDTALYYHKADSLLQAIRHGANFEQVARESSNDKPTAEKGGDMDTINHEDRRTELPFDRAAYSLKDGEISGIVHTSFGYHIIKRLNGVRPRTFEESKEHLEQFYKRYYFDEDRAHFIDSLQQVNHYSLDSSALNYVMAHIDSSRTSADSNWSAKLTNRSMTIFHIGDINWTVGTLIDTLNATTGSPLARNQLRNIIKTNSENAALQIEARVIPQRYPDFEKIMEDYKNGIILFDLENKRVWSKVTPDSMNEEKYYEAHKASFLWPERVDLTEIFVTKDSLAKEIYKKAMAGENFDTLAKKYTERPGFKQKAGHWGLLARHENQLSDKAFDFIVGEIKEPFAFQGGYSIVRLNNREPLHQKTFAEAKQEVASQYQDERAQELRAQWVEDLRKKYEREINEPIITAEWTKMHNDPAASEESHVMKN